MPFTILGARWQAQKPVVLKRSIIALPARVYRGQRAIICKILLCAPSDVLRANIPPVHALDILLSADVIRMALASREAGQASEAAVQIYSFVIEQPARHCVRFGFRDVPRRALIHLG